MKPDPHAMDGDWTLLVEEQSLSENDRPYTFRDGKIWQAPHPDPIGSYALTGMELIMLFTGAEGCIPSCPATLRARAQDAITAETEWLQAAPVIDRAPRVAANDDDGLAEEQSNKELDFLLATWGGDYFTLFREGPNTASIRADLRAHEARRAMRVVSVA